MISWYTAAREEGKYRAIGGHRASPSMRRDPSTHRTLCGVCGRTLNWREDRHYTKPRRSAK